MKITYEDKVAVDPVSAYPRKNKITAEDLNEIKEVVNANADNPNAVVLYSSSRSYEDIPAEWQESKVEKVRLISNNTK